MNQTSAATVAHAYEYQASTGSSLKANGVCWHGKQSLWKSGSCNQLWFLSCLILVKFSPRNTNVLCWGPPDIKGRAHLPAFVHALLAWEHLSILLICLSLLILPDSGDWKKTKLFFQVVDVSPRRCIECLVQCLTETTLRSDVYCLPAHPSSICLLA